MKSLLSVDEMIGIYIFDPISQLLVNMFGNCLALNRFAVQTPSVDYSIAIISTYVSFFYLTFSMFYNFRSVWYVASYSIFLATNTDLEAQQNNIKEKILFHIRK